jgi:hypothetical protein
MVVAAEPFTQPATQPAVMVFVKRMHGLLQREIDRGHGESPTQIYLIMTLIFFQADTFWQDHPRLVKVP